MVGKLLPETAVQTEAQEADKLVSDLIFKTQRWTQVILPSAYFLHPVTKQQVVYTNHKVQINIMYHIVAHGYG